MADVDMVTTAEVTAALEISGTGRNTLIAALITQASHALNAKYQRELTPQTTSTAHTWAPV